MSYINLIIFLPVKIYSYSFQIFLGFPLHSLSFYFPNFFLVSSISLFYEWLSPTFPPRLLSTCPLFVPTIGSQLRRKGLKQNNFVTLFLKVDSEATEAPKIRSVVLQTMHPALCSKKTNTNPSTTMTALTSFLCTLPPSWTR